MPPPGVCLNIIEARYKKDGFGKFTKPQKFLGQDYEQLKQYCLTRGVSFIDETFLPDRRSIGQEILRHGILSPSELACVEWRRPAVSVASEMLILGNFVKLNCSADYKKSNSVLVLYLHLD